jgi:hypothetical protein
MALSDSAGGLINAVNNKVDSLLPIVGGIACIPSLLSGLGGNIGAGVKGALSIIGKSLLNSATAIAAAAIGLVTSIVADAIDQITGAVAGVINAFNAVIADVLNVVNMVQAEIAALKQVATDLLKAVQDKENCKFFAANLAKCMAAAALDNLSKKLAAKVKPGSNSFTTTISNITDKISQPAVILNKVINKASASVDKATSSINAINII